jgi:hypothetical protein
MVNKPLILLAKRFRSKALPAASLFPTELVDSRRIAFDILLNPYCDTVSKGRGEACPPIGSGEG